MLPEQTRSGELSDCAEIDVQPFARALFCRSPERTGNTIYRVSRWMTVLLARGRDLRIPGEIDQSIIRVPEILRSRSAQGDVAEARRV